MRTDQLSVSDKKGNGKRFANFQRDALFFPAFRALREACIPAVSGEISVTTPTHSIPPSSSIHFTRFIASKSSPKDTHIIQARRPAKWRDLTSWAQAYYRHVSAYELGQVHGFSLNLNQDIEEKARAEKSAAVWLQKRIARELRKALPGEDPTFWFMIEQVNGWRHLHLHGEIVTSDIKAARKALRLAAGEWKSVRQHQAHTQADPDDGWIGYAFKEHAWTANGMFAHLRGFSGDPYASTRNLTQMATKAYEADRLKVLALQ